MLHEIGDGPLDGRLHIEGKFVASTPAEIGDPLDCLRPGEVAVDDVVAGIPRVCLDALHILVGDDIDGSLAAAMDAYLHTVGMGQLYRLT